MDDMVKVCDRCGSPRCLEPGRKVCEYDGLPRGVAEIPRVKAERGSEPVRLVGGRRR